MSASLEAELDARADEFKTEPTERNKARVLEAWDRLVTMATSSPLTQAEKAEIRIGISDLLDEVLSN